jgi:glycosyltransferase involved in cell wall biosynthesis
LKIGKTVTGDSPNPTIKDLPHTIEISTIIPAYNAAGHIGRALDSVLAQTQPPAEIIVVDDGSTDDTAEIVRSYGEIVQCITAHHVGAGQARNMGIEAARYPWIAFLDADDEWLPEKLVLQAALVNRHPDLVWCYSNMYVQRKGRQDRTLSHDPQRVGRLLGADEVFDDYLQALAAGAPTSCITWMIRREALEAVGGFCQHRRWAQDADLALRLAYRWPRIGYVRRPLAINHFGRLDSITVRHWNDVEQRCRFIEQHAELAKQAGAWSRFRPCAQVFLAQWVRRFFKADPPVDLKPLERQWGHLLPRRLRWELRVRRCLGSRLGGIVDVYLRTKDRLRRCLRW